MRDGLFNPSEVGNPPMEQTCNLCKNTRILKGELTNLTGS